jgi:hypothetical protein
MNRIVMGFGLVAALGACSARQEDGAGRVAARVVQCDVTPPPGAWVCGTNRTFECSSPNGTPIDPMFVVPVAIGDGGAPDCSTASFSSNLSGPLQPGAYTIIVTETGDGGSVEACRSNVTIVDTTPPMATSKDTAFWPPNHSMHTVTIDDCVTVSDTCDANPTARFTYVAVDEAANAKGSGNTTPDVTFSTCNSVDLRSERQGGGDGRVYRLGWRAADRYGNVTLGECQVAIAHDQSGAAAVAGSEVYRLNVCP